MGVSNLVKTIVRNRHTVSTIFRPTNVVPANSQVADREKKSTPQKANQTETKSVKLMLDNGLIRHSSTTGAFHLLPLALKSLDKLISLIDFHMEKVGGQRIKMPLLTNSQLWKKSGRLEDCGSELMQLTDRHSKEYILAPTYEEAICDLLSSQTITYRQLPMRLYQITEKFRDEMKPRFGLMRSREFLMKDLYTFDVSENSALETYNEIIKTYEDIFSTIGVHWIKASAASGIMGGTLSHEFHFPSDVGEDIIGTCSNCQETFNFEVLNKPLNTEDEKSEDSKEKRCPKCGSEEIQKSQAIEVGHTFLLGNKYTKPLKATFANEKAKLEVMEMGCYGLGVSRILSAVIEVLSTPDEIRWPRILAPYLVMVLPPKAGSKEERYGKVLADKMYTILNGFLHNDVLLDDRTNLTIGKRLVDAKKLGIPFIIVFGKTVKDDIPTVEIHDLNAGTVSNMLEKEIPNYFYDIKTKSKISN